MNTEEAKDIGEVPPSHYHIIRLQPMCRAQTSILPNMSSAAWKEARLLVNLAVPTVLVQLGATFPPALTASFIGRHLGSVYLDSFTLASLTGNLFTLSLLQGLYSASDTLSPQAFGAGNYKEVGLLAMRGFVGSLFLIVPTNIVLAMYMKDILVWVGEDEVTSALAARWYKIYMFGLPFYALYNVTWKFLSAQEIMAPLLVVLVATCGIVLPLALDRLVPWLGFIGSAIAILIYQASQAGLLLLYLSYKQPHNPMTWPGLHLWREALAPKPFLAFLRLGAGGMVAASVSSSLCNGFFSFALTYGHISFNNECYYAIPCPSLNILLRGRSLLFSIYRGIGMVVLGSIVFTCWNVGRLAS